VKEWSSECLSYNRAFSQDAWGNLSPEDSKGVQNVGNKAYS
jgi:hypothetical protein